MPKLSEFLFGKESKMKQRPIQTPQQQQLFNSILSQLAQGSPQALQLLQSFLTPGQDGVEQFSQPYLQQFEEQIIPRIAERFAGGAQGGALSSSGFAQALGGAGAGLQSQLAQLYSGRQQDAISKLLGLSQGLSSTPTFGFTQRPASTGILGGIFSGLGQGFESSLSGPLGGSLSRMF